MCALCQIERPTRMTPDPDLAVILSSARRQQEREQLRKRKPRPPPKATGEVGQTQSLTQSLTQSVKDKKEGKEGQEGKGASSKGSKDGKAPADGEHGSEGKGPKGKGKSAKSAKEDLKKLQADLEANAEAREARERLRRKRHRQYVRQRRSTIAAPEGLYARLRKFEGQSRVRIEIARCVLFPDPMCCQIYTKSQSLCIYAHTHGLWRGYPRCTGVRASTFLRGWTSPRPR